MSRGNNDALDLWRKTIITSTNEPYSVQWVYPGKNESGRMHLINQQNPRYMILSYDYPGSAYPALGYWTPGEEDEYVYYPDNEGNYREDYASVFLRHKRIAKDDELIETYSPKLVSVSSSMEGMIPLSELNTEWITFLAKELYGSNNAIHRFIKRYIKNKPINASFTAEDNIKLRRELINIFKKANTKKNLRFAIADVKQDWLGIIAEDPDEPGDSEYRNLFLDTKLLNSDMQKEDEDEDVLLEQEFSTEPIPRRRRSQRILNTRRLAKYYADADNVYDGGRRRRRGKRTHRDKCVSKRKTKRVTRTRKNKLVKK
jgi:hypothetical protein